MNNIPLTTYGTIDTPIDTDCQRCQLKNCRINVTKSYIPPQTEILIVGESPGETEDLNPLLPFCGSAGEELDRCMKSIGVYNKYMYNIGYTNIVRCRPRSFESPGKIKNRPLKESEIKICGDYLDWEIKQLPNLKLIVCLGDLVAKRFIGKTGITLSNLRNNIIPTEKYGNIIVTYHPGAVARTSSIIERNSVREAITADLYKAFEVINGKTYEKKEFHYFVTKNIEQVRWAFKQIDKVDLFTFDTETSSFYHTDKIHEMAGHDNTLLCVSFGVKERVSITIPLVGRDWLEIWTPEEKAEIYEGLKAVFSNPYTKKVAQNAKFDIKHLAAAGFRVCNLWGDTMVMHYLLDENSKHDLKSLAIRYTDLGNYDAELENIKLQVAKERKKKKEDLGYQEIPTNILWKYANGDVDATYRLYFIFLEMLQRENLLGLFYELYLPLILELAYIEFKGVKIDIVKLDEAIVTYSQNIKKIKETILRDVNVQMYVNRKIKAHKATRVEKWLSSSMLQKKYTKEAYANIGVEKVEFNIGSPAQLGELFIDQMNLPVMKKTKGGGASFDDEALEEYAYSIPLAHKINTHNKMCHFQDTFLLGIKSRLSSEGYLHTSFNLNVAKTGRLSSSDPNLQNIPNKYKDKDTAKLIRDIFIADDIETDLMVNADYSQAEFRMWGQLSGDKILAEDLRQGLDVHTNVACLGFGISEEIAQTGDYRLQAKQVVFGNMYGRGLKSVALKLGISLEQAQILQDVLFKKYPDAAKWLSDVKIAAKRDRYVVGLFGQKRHLNGLIDSWNRDIKAKAERQSINSPIQGSASQMTCFAFIKVARALRQRGLHARVTLLIHDAIMLVAKKHDINEVVSVVKECMLSPHPKVTIPLKVDVEVGSSWGTMEKFKQAA